jgi:PAS domain S-box-containing protein
VSAQLDAQRQRELLAVAGRMARLGGWRLDLATAYAYHSEQVRLIHDLGPGEGFDLAGALSYYPPPARERLVAALAACRERGEPFDLELPLVTARGREAWVRVSGEAATDEQGRIVALHGALQDLTDQHRDGLALAESRARLDAVVRVLPDLWMVFDADDRHVDVSDPEHPALDRPWSDKVGRRLPDTIDPTLARQMRRAADDARRTGELHSYFYDLTVRSGERRHFEGRSVPMDGGRWMMLARDNTEVVHLERRFRTLTDALPVGVFETDPRGRFSYLNPACQDLLGLTGPEGLGIGWTTQVHPDDRVRVRRLLRNAVRQSRRLAVEFRLARRDGELRRVAVQVNALRRVDGHVVGHVGSVVDVTQAHELEQARRAREVAEEVARRQATFLSRLSHELRTPLNAIIGFTELMLMQPASAAAPAPGRHLGHVRDAGAHMLALVNDLLELQRLQQGQVLLHPEPVVLAEAVQSCLALLDPLMRQRTVRLDLQVDPALVLETDRRTLLQVLLNLASNAVKYGRAEGGRLAIRAREAAGGRLRIEVGDDGPGLTPPQQQRLFQPFERLGQERSGQPGTGLGLVITRQLAQLLGGDLHLTSEPGVGTTVTLDLPRERTPTSIEP